jgi:hypothetical protein
MTTLRILLFLFIIFNIHLRVKSRVFNGNLNAKIHDFDIKGKRGLKNSSKYVRSVTSEKNKDGKTSKNKIVSGKNADQEGERNRVNKRNKRLRDSNSPDSKTTLNESNTKEREDRQNSVATLAQETTESFLSSTEIDRTNYSPLETVENKTDNSEKYETDENNKLTNTDYGESGFLSKCLKYMLIFS